MKSSDQGVLLQSQSFSVNDGEGIRNTIFLAGCPLRCRWCANPETWTPDSKIVFYQDHCIGCDQCQAICPKGISPSRQNANEEGCDGCGVCVEACPQNALGLLCKPSTIDPILKKIEREEVFFRYSDGGVTFSGGEPTFQAHFLRGLTKKLYHRRISIWIETCGYFSWEATQDIFQMIDHVFYDLKCMNEALHKEMTGVSNQVILENCKNLAQSGIPLTVRIPLIREVNCNEENLTATARFVVDNVPGKRVELLPYHDFGKEKYQAMKMEKCFTSFTTPTDEEMLQARKLLSSFGVKLVDYK